MSDSDPVAPWETDDLRAWETDVVLADGSTARVRPIRPTDRDRLRQFHARQSPESIYFRYFRFRPELTERDLDQLTTLDYRNRMAFVAVRGDDLIAVARYEPWGDRNEAEVAFFVDDAYNGRGLATILLEFLAAAARRRGLDGFTASVLPENYAMLRVFRKAGFDVSTRFVDGVIEVALGIDVTKDAQAAIGARSRRSIARSVARVLEPRSVAVVGASRRPDSVGAQVLQQLLAAPFAGDVSVVHPDAPEIQGVACVTRLTDLETAPDLAVVVAPTGAVEQVTLDAVSAGVGALLIISAGFAESGPEGIERERRLLSIVRNGGVRLVGPNAFGVANTDPAVNLRALFLPVEVKAGPVGLLSQSGPLGAALLDDLARSGVGVSTFAALGNRADVSVNDMLQYWAEDERTEAIALYIENFGNLRKFTAIAREVAASKPIVSVATPDDDLNEMVRQSGVILVNRVSELAEQLRLAIDQPRPRGHRVAVVSNTSSVARLAVAACRRAGLEVVGPHNGATLVGDVDQLDTVGGAAGLSIYERTLSATALAENVDSVVVGLVPSFDLPIPDLRDILIRVDRAVAKPMVAVGLIDPDQLDVPGLPCFTFPEGAAAVLGRMAGYSAWRQGADSPPIAADAEFAEPLRALLDTILGEEPDPFGRRLDEVESQQLLSCLGIGFAPWASVDGPAAACDAAGRLGYPVAVKAGGLVARTAGEHGGTALDVGSDAELIACIERMAANFGDRLHPLQVQAMVPSGLHLAVRLRQDFEQGAGLMVAPGGTGVFATGHRVLRALPAGRPDLVAITAADWLAETLTPATRHGLEELLVVLARAAAAAPELALVRLNPVLVSEQGAFVTDSEVWVRPWPRHILDDLRHL